MRSESRWGRGRLGLDAGPGDWIHSLRRAGRKEGRKRLTDKAVVRPSNPKQARQIDREADRVSAC